MRRSAENAQTSAKITLSVCFADYPTDMRQSAGEGADYAMSVFTPIGFDIVACGLADHVAAGANLLVEREPMLRVFALVHGRQIDEAAQRATLARCPVLQLVEQRVAYEGAAFELSDAGISSAANAPSMAFNGNPVQYAAGPAALITWWLGTLLSASGRFVSFALMAQRSSRMPRDARFRPVATTICGRCSSSAARESATPWRN